MVFNKDTKLGISDVKKGGNGHIHKRDLKKNIIPSYRRVILYQ